jgi:hypothetical protein
VRKRFKNFFDWNYDPNASVNSARSSGSIVYVNDYVVGKGLNIEMTVHQPEQTCTLAGI